MPSLTVTRPYYPRLDGLRGLAILAVLAEHLVRSSWVTDWNPGMIGVKTFFVLSGFLISSILFAEREGGRPWRGVAGSFFFRRALRLWPAYYLAIAAAVVFGVAGMRDLWLVHGLYLTNFLIAHRGEWGGAGHFWTLAVEEQYYLLWFPLVILAPRRWLLPVVLGALALGSLARLPIALGASEFYAVLMPAQIDSFAMGALVALAWRKPGLAGLDRLLASPVALWTMLSVVVLLLRIGNHPILSWVALPAAVNITSACFVRASVGNEPGLTRLLEQGWLIHVGRISYGLYVYHYFLPQLLTPEVLGVEGLGPVAQKLTLAVVWLIVSLLVAEASWRWMERPILGLKNARRSTPKPSEIDLVDH